VGVLWLWRPCSGVLAVRVAGDGAAPRVCFAVGGLTAPAEHAHTRVARTRAQYCVQFEFNFNYKTNNKPKKGKRKNNKM